MLIHPLMTTPQGAIWADARACGRRPDAAEGNVALGGMSVKHRQQAAVFGGSYGTGVSNGITNTRPEGLGGSAG